MRPNLAAVITVILAFSFNIAHTQVAVDRWNGKRTIEVTGVYEMDVDPDEIYLGLILKERADGRDKLTIDKQESELKKLLTEQQISIEGLAVEDMTGSYESYRLFKKETVLKKEFRLKVKSAAEMRKAFEVFDKLNIEDAWVDRMAISKIETVLKDARIKAIQAAQEKATYMTAAIGNAIGGPLNISEVERYVSSEMNGRAMYNLKVRNASFQSSPSEGPEVPLSRIKIRIGIFVVFEIKS